MLESAVAAIVALLLVRSSRKWQNSTLGQPGHDVARDYLLQRLQRTRLVPFLGDSFGLSYFSGFFP
jgi:hypothetical protein